MNLKKSIILFFVSIMTLGIFTPLASAKAVDSQKSSNTTPISELSNEEIQDMLAEELEFYFSEVGYLDENNEYHVTNPELLEEKINEGNEAADTLYSKASKNLEPTITTYGSKDFFGCVLGDQFAWVVEMIDGNTLNALASAMQSHAWNTAASILATALAQVSKVAGASVSIGFTVASLAISAYSCRNTW